MGDGVVEAGGGGNRCGITRKRRRKADSVHAVLGNQPAHGRVCGGGVTGEATPGAYKIPGVEALGTLWKLCSVAESNMDVNISSGPASDIAALLSCGVEGTAATAASVLKLCPMTEGNQALVFKPTPCICRWRLWCTARRPCASRQRARVSTRPSRIADSVRRADWWHYASEGEALTRKLRLDAIGSAPGVVDAKGAVWQRMAPLEQLLLDIAEFRQLYYASRRGQVRPESVYSDLGATLPTEPTPLLKNGIGGEGVAAIEGAGSTATATTGCDAK